MDFGSLLSEKWRSVHSITFYNTLLAHMVKKGWSQSQLDNRPMTRCYIITGLTFTTCLHTVALRQPELNKTEASSIFTAGSCERRERSRLRGATCPQTANHSQLLQEQSQPGANRWGGNNGGVNKIIKVSEEILSPSLQVSLFCAV